MLNESRNKTKQRFSGRTARISGFTRRLQRGPCQYTRTEPGVLGQPCKLATRFARNGAPMSPSCPPIAIIVDYNGWLQPTFTMNGNSFSTIDILLKACVHMIRIVISFRRLVYAYVFLGAVCIRCRLGKFQRPPVGLSSFFQLHKTRVFYLALPHVQIMPPKGKPCTEYIIPYRVPRVAQ